VGRPSGECRLRIKGIFLKIRFDNDQIMDFGLAWHGLVFRMVVGRGGKAISRGMGIFCRLGLTLRRLGACWRELAGVVVVWLACGAPAVAQVADGAGDIYTARAIVTGTNERDRPRGLAICLGQVLVNVSGDPNILGRKGVAALEARAETMVTGLDYVDRMSGLRKHDEQGTRDRPFTLTATFDPAKVTAALAALGAAPFTGKRPAVFLVLRVDGYAGRFALLKGPIVGYDMPELMRQSIGDAAWQYKLSVTLPEGAGESVPAGAMAVDGTLTWSDADHGWLAAWETGGVRWGERGVSFDDAFQGALAGALGVASGHGPPRG
jgi:hypothetical protein